MIIPLYAATMNPTPLMFGLVFSAAHVLPLFLSIHTGALMDRLGARRVMLVCTTVGAVIPAVLSGRYLDLGAGVRCRLFFGLCESMGWLGAQTMIGQYMYGKTVYAGRLSFIIRIGQFAAGPMAGATWDLFGPCGRVRADGAMGLWLYRMLAAVAAAAAERQRRRAGERRAAGEGARALAQRVRLSHCVPAARRAGGD